MKKSLITKSFLMHFVKKRNCSVEAVGGIPKQGLFFQKGTACFCAREVAGRPM
jgi:hypothetical protein